MHIVVYIFVMDDDSVEIWLLFYVLPFVVKLVDIGQC
jgi:hypothetical protein